MAYTIGIKELRSKSFGSKRELAEYIEKYIEVRPSCARVYRIEDGFLIPTNHVIAKGTNGRLVVREQRLHKGEVEFLKMIVNRSLITKKKED